MDINNFKIEEEILLDLKIDMIFDFTRDCYSSVASNKSDLIFQLSCRNHEIAAHLIISYRNKLKRKNKCIELGSVKGM